MCSITTSLRDRGISLAFLKENLTFSASENSEMQDLQLHIMSAFSQFERSLIKERQADGPAVEQCSVNAHIWEAGPTRIMALLW